MKFFQITILLLILVILLGCSVLKLQTEGTVQPSEFYEKITFETYKTVIGIDVEIDGKTRKFLFDTGADFCIFHKDTIHGKKENFSGASKRKMELAKEKIASIKIGSVNFKNTWVFAGDMTGLKEQVPGFGGIIGQSVIRKANWLINYPAKEMEISNQELDGNNYKTIGVKRDDSYNPYTFLEVNGKKYKVLIDFGSSSTINLPAKSQFAKDIMRKIELAENTRDRYTLGGVQQIKEKEGVIPLVKLGDIQFKNVHVNINTSSQPRIGISFFKNYSIYIDNTNGGLIKLKK